MTTALPCYCIHRHLPKFDVHSSFGPLVQQLGSTVIPFDFRFLQRPRWGWRIGHVLHTASNWYAQSTWNALAPWVDERRFLKTIRPGPSLVHFLWAEFASPRWAGPYRRRGARLIGTFHCSARRLPSVLKGFDPRRRYDFITLMSQTQAPFFLERGFPAERLQVILHGVDTDFFCPAEAGTLDPTGRLRLLLVGDTERDHEFAARLFASLPPDRFTIRVKTKAPNHAAYRACPRVQLLEPLNGEQLREAYRQSDLVVLPLLDCTANNTVLEAMACGIPVMANQVGGVSEYLHDEAHYLMPDKVEAQWRDGLLHLADHPEDIRRRQPLAREDAVRRFGWPVIVPQYHALYDRVANAS